ncbi:MAG TPA: aminoacyl-tRNA hydrolase [Anaerolineales bacterium]|nr:aminoacyl-tRNA hydrolase [Anaerolineales bacterium]HUS84005.1 aminoacyl-tRNA hydrolase [Anaerolineales bacterium]
MSEHQGPYLLAGLGNPGREFRRNRHNIGFMLIDHLAHRWDLTISRMQSEALIAIGRVNGEKIYLTKPQTFMNLIGRSIASLTRYYRIPPSNLIVIYDDLDLPLGIVRIRPEGGSGGHKGMSSIIDALQSNQIPRMRIGIGRPSGKMDPAAFVLQDFDAEDADLLDMTLHRSADCIDKLLFDGIETAMNSCNPKPADT